MWVCRCDCGRELSVLSSSLTAGNTRSCGCLRAEVLGTLSPAHKTAVRPIEERLLERRGIDQCGCWIWLGRGSCKGYGQMSVGARMKPVHRLAYECWVGPIGSETVHHKCANPRCFNPEHLELASHRENVGEMMSRGALSRRIAELEAEVAALRAAQPVSGSHFT